MKNSPGMWVNLVKKNLGSQLVKTSKNTKITVDKAACRLHYLSPLFYSFKIKK
jgi:hypothetical protein